MQFTLSTLYQMKNFFSLLLLITVSNLFFYGCNKRSGKPNVLVFTKTTGYRHSSIDTGVKAIFKLGQENNFTVDTTSDASMFNEDTLKKYAAVVFLSTTDSDDKLLNNYEENAFQRYIEAGGRVCWYSCCH